MAKNYPARVQSQRRSAPTPLLTTARQGLGESPFGLVRRFSEDMDRLFGDVLADFGMERRWPRTGRHDRSEHADWSPAIEVVERDDELVICVDLPGMSADDINVEVADDVVAITGERRDERERT